MSEDRPALAASLMVSALCMLALQDSLVKLASADVSLWQFQTLRALCNLTMLFVLSRFIWGNASVWPKRFWTVALRSGFLVGAMLSFFGAIPFLSLSEVAAGLYVFPLFVAVLSAVILGERVGPRRIAAVVAGFAGTLLILKPASASFQWVSLVPVLAGLFYAATVLTTRKLCREESPATLALGVSVAFVTVGALGLATMETLKPAELAASWPYLFVGWNPLALEIAALIVVCSMLNLTANISLAKAYQSAESSWLAPFDYSYLIFATFWGVVMWGDVPDLLSFTGMAMIAGSGCYVAWRERKESRLREADLNRALR
ncbi:EamA family transporter [Anderseniella sp. Alg231-50]|uniref:EamA family transporter n=1 Tax=Anderseniella sp. Alg231-50 TaxID=1922226 RepID=UPI000D559572